MNNIKVLGIDFAKNYFQLHGIDKHRMQARADDTSKPAERENQGYEPRHPCERLTCKQQHEDAANEQNCTVFNTQIVEAHVIGLRVRCWQRHRRGLP